MNRKDLIILEQYSQAIFGCPVCDLSESEERMLIAHVREREPEFMNHR